MSTETPLCDATGCNNAGKYQCKRCHHARYCSSNCQKLCWPTHKLQCSGKLEQAYQFDYSYDRTVAQEQWLRSEMQKGPEQPMDPPEEFDYYWPWWNDRELTLEGKVVVTSSFLPPALKELIRKGLRNKDITWAYLFSDNFMRIATYSWVPLQYVLEALEFTVLPAEVKPSLQGLTEVVVEHFWRVIGLPGQGNYDPAVAAMLRRHEVTLPFTYSHCYEDEFRLWTHRMQAPYPPCACWGCQVRPYKAAREREAWEGLRRKAAKQGQFMMSWVAKEELEAQLLAQGEGSTPAGTSGQKEAAAQATTKESALAWTHGPDERATLRSNLTRRELAEVMQLVDAVNKQQRLPTSAELDAIMALVSVSKHTFVQQTRSDVTRSVATAQKAQSEGGGRRNVPIRNPVAAATSSAVDKCSAQLSSVHLQGAAVAAQVSAEDEDGDAEKHIGTSSDDVMCTIAARRPQRSAARKAVSYAEAAGSSDDSHLSQAGPQRRRRSHNGQGSGPTRDEEGSDRESTEGWSSSEQAGSDSDAESDSSGTSSDLATEESADDREESVEGARRPRRSTKRHDKPRVSKKQQTDHGLMSGDGRCVWNSDMDARLKAAVALYKENEGWRRVAAHVGGGVTGEQCNYRWNKALQHQGKDLRTADWTPEETARLEELVAAQRAGAAGKNVDWQAIAQALGRVPHDCSTKHRHLLESRMKKGPYSAEEDALILRRVEEWGDRGNGLWVALQEEMGRPGNSMRMRWTNTLNKK